MRPLVLSMCMALAFGCQRREAAQAEKPKAEPVTMPAAGMPQMRVGSASFHLEIGNVYERFQDQKSAVEHLLEAVKAAEDRAQRVRAYSALARVKEAGGDSVGAIDALEHARTELDDVKAPMPPGASALVGPSAGPADDILLRLARLYVDAGRYEEAELLCERGLSGTDAPWQREQFLRLEVDLYRKAGTLAKKLTDKEKALEQARGDEAALRFLTVAFASDGMPGLVVNGGPVHPQADSGKLIRAHERLYELHPEDPQLRQSLQALLERAGRIEDAVKLATTTPAVTPAECVGAFAPPASGALHGRAEAIRIRMRAAQPDKALAETAKLGAIANQAGIGAHLAAAQLYLELGATGRATQAIDRAAQKARSREDQRQVAFVRERMLAGKGRTAELKGLYQAWSRSEDPCLRLAAAQREQQAGGLAVGPSMLPPPMP